MVLIAAVAGIMVAATLAVTMTSAAFADPRNNDYKSDKTATGGNGGIGGAGGAGGTAGGGSSGSGNYNINGGGDANGGNGGDANGGNACLFKCRN